MRQQTVVHLLLRACSAVEAENAGVAIAKTHGGVPYLWLCIEAWLEWCQQPEIHFDWQSGLAPYRRSSQKADPLPAGGTRNSAYNIYCISFVQLYSSPGDWEVAMLSTKFFRPSNGTRSRQPSCPGAGRGKTCESCDLAGGPQDLGGGPTTGGMWNLRRAASAEAFRHQWDTGTFTFRRRDWVYSGQHQGWISWWKTIGAIDKWLVLGQSWPWQGFGTRSCAVQRQILQQWQSSLVLPQGVSGKCSLECQGCSQSLRFSQSLRAFCRSISRETSEGWR